MYLSAIALNQLAAIRGEMKREGILQQQTMPRGQLHLGLHLHCNKHRPRNLTLNAKSNENEDELVSDSHNMYKYCSFILSFCASYTLTLIFLLVFRPYLV